MELVGDRWFIAWALQEKTLACVSSRASTALRRVDALLSAANQGQQSLLA